jgi:hypothetical protein
MSSTRPIDSKKVTQAVLETDYLAKFAKLAKAIKANLKGLEYGG